VRNRVGDIGASHAQRGLGTSGVVIAAIFADVQKEFEEGIADALGELKRAIRTTKLDRHELRQAALQCLENFTIGCKAATGADRFRSLPSMGDYIDRRLREFDEVLRFKIRQFDVGFLDPQEPEVPHVSNTINVESMIGSTIQQGSSRATQTVQFTLNIGATGAALSAFEAAIQGVDLSENRHNSHTACKTFAEHHHRSRGGEIGAECVRRNCRWAFDPVDKRGCFDLMVDDWARVMPQLTCSPEAAPYPRMFTRSQEAMRRLFTAKRDLTGNFPAFQLSFPTAWRQWSTPRRMASESFP